MRRALRRFDLWMFRPGSATRLGAVRIGLCLILAARLSRPLYLGLAGQPPVLFRPISFMHLFAAMPNRNVTLAMECLGVAAALMAAAGVAARVTLPVAFVCALVLDGMTTSVGKVVHNDVLLLLAMVPLLFAPAGDALSLSASRRRTPRATVAAVRYGWPLRLSMLLVAGGYFFTGFNKLVFSGPAWFASDNLRWVLFGVSDSSPRPIQAALFVAEHPALAQLVAAATLAVELGFPIVLWKPRAAWVFVPGALLLHAGILLTMHLDYSAWALTALVLFTPWDRLAARGGGGVPAAARTAVRATLEG